MIQIAITNDHQGDFRLQKLRVISDCSFAKATSDGHLAPRFWKADEKTEIERRTVWICAQISCWFYWWCRWRRQMSAVDCPTRFFSRWLIACGSILQKEYDCVNNEMHGEKQFVQTDRIISSDPALAGNVKLKYEITMFINPRMINL